MQRDNYQKLITISKNQHILRKNHKKVWILPKPLEFFESN